MKALLNKFNNFVPAEFFDKYTKKNKDPKLLCFLENCLAVFMFRMIVVLRWLIFIFYGIKIFQQKVKSLKIISVRIHILTED